MRDFSEDWDRKPSICSKGLAVAWKDVIVTAVEEKSKLFSKTEYIHKEIIHGVSGAVQPETLVAILGASGSGKSTLMSILANRNPAGLQVDGTITIGGKPKGEFTRYVSGFVYQDDLFISTLTVTEHLNFTAKLRLGKNVSEKARMILIEDILNLLGLKTIANSRIGKARMGNEKLNLSGGERKRLSIAAELITDPGLLFCDEPTTGLDSFTALNVITYLKSLTVLKQKTIVCSIHQPNGQIVGLFHQIILVSNGRIAFNGPTDAAVSFFEEHGYPYSEDENPADYLIRSLANEVSKNTINKFCLNFLKSKHFEKVEKLINKEIDRNDFHNSVVFYKSQDEPTRFKKLMYLTHRNMLSLSRDFSIQGIRLFQKMLIGLLIGVTMHGTVTWTQTGLTSLKGAIFMLITQNFFPPIHVAMSYIPGQLSLFYREYSNNVSTPFIFYVSNVISLLPGFILDPVLFTLLICYLIGLTNSVVSIILSCLLTTLVLNASAAFGMLMSTAVKNFEVANSYIAPTEITLIICSGVYIKLSTIPWILKWIRYVSWFTYACEAMFIIQLDGVTEIECDSSLDVPCLSNGDEVLSSYDFDAVNLWPNIIKIIGIYFIFHVVAYICLLKRLKQRTA